MTSSRTGAISGVAVLLALGHGTLAARASGQAPAGQVAPAPAPAAQATPAPGRPSKSVFGKLSSVDKTRNAIVMKSDAGESLGWQFHPRVIAEAARFKPGDPMIVIYRGISDNEKRVTAVAFPGSATTPIYVNTTGSRVVVRSAPAVNGVCGQENAGPATDAVIPHDGTAEVLDACWCCAVPGETCNPANRSGQGRALLVQCFN
jgi:hypothetical protein